MHVRILALVLVVALAMLAGCAGRAWRQARAEDSVGAYHRYLRDHPETTFAPRARARLELARIRDKPRRKGFLAFQEEFGEAFPELVAELKPHVEEVFFRHARAVGTAAAYHRFLDRFPDGAFAARAAGNADYLAHDGLLGDVEALAAFARRHPESDYAAEAERSVASVAVRSASEFQRVGLVVRVDPATPGAARLDRVFRERAFAAYAAAGLELVQVSSARQAQSAGLPAVLRIDHREREVGTQLDQGRVTEPSFVAETRVVLARVDSEEPIWSDAFEYRTPVSAGREGVSILFGPGSHSSYWADLDGVFFVPIARWNTRATARTPQSFSKPAVALEVVGSRAVVLFGDGDFQLYDLGDPARPLPLGRYRRPRDLSTFEGVRIAGDRAAVFGPDGIEMVHIDGEATARGTVYGRDSVGSVVGVEEVGGEWVAATNRGLLWLGGNPESVGTLVSRPILGLDKKGDRLVFTDGSSLYVASLPLLKKGRVEAQLRLGRGFHPEAVRVHGDTGVVIGARDAVWVDLRDPRRPRLLSRVGGKESGRIRDAAVVGQRLFLLGPRGLQVLGPGGERIVDSVDVIPREHLDVSGRHLVMIGDKSLQVVDATAFVATAPAARDR